MTFAVKTSNMYRLGVSHISFFVHNASWWRKYHDTPTPYYMCHFQTFDKIDSFLKMFQMSLTGKKWRLYLWRSASFTYSCWLAFFSLPLWIPGGNRAKLKKLFNLNSRLSWGAQNPDTQNLLIIFLLSIAVMQAIFWRSFLLLFWLQ